MFKTISIFFSFYILLNLLACTGTTSDIDHESELIYQIPGCQNHRLTKAAVNDSSFSYSFGENLIANFIVKATCCPDSDRFELTTRINNDTIYVTVLDTSLSLCDCICNYQIHFEKSNLPLANYLFYCNYNDSIIYAVRVFRNQYY